ncbi:Hypothetical predicted protein, partial [Podarcis lilfordi]
MNDMGKRSRNNVAHIAILTGPQSQCLHTVAFGSPECVYPYEFMLFNYMPILK